MKLKNGLEAVDQEKETVKAKLEKVTSAAKTQLMNA